MQSEDSSTPTTGRIAHASWVRGGAAGFAVAAVAAASLVLMAGGAQAAATAVPLGTAASFAVLAGAGITNTGPTTLTGDIGTFPTTSITGAGSLTITGTNHAGDSVTQGAKADLVTAYDVAAGQGPTTPVSADLAGQTLVSGVYNSSSSMGLTGELTLDAAGNPNAVFVFQVASALTIASSSTITLTNGAQACNVYWQVGSSATLGTAAAFKGNILALTDITLTTGATLEGRVLARNGAVTLDTNVITRPTCITSVTTPPATTATGTSTATSTATSTPVGPTTPGTDTPSPTTTSVPSASPTGPSPSTPVVPDVTTPPVPQVTETPRGGIDTGDGSFAHATLLLPLPLR